MQLNNEDFLRIAAIIKSKYGLNLNGKKFLVESRLTNYVLDCGFNSFSEYFHAVFNDRSGGEMANIINKLTTNYTYFMREADHFKHFTDVFLNNAKNNFEDKELRIWSAGCSFGNEPYSIVMCMDEFFGEEKAEWDSKILATDISLNALRMAKKGVFTEQALEHISPQWIDKYFTKRINGTYQVNEAIRNDVVFKYHNLMDEITFKKQFDLIVCRNVMIYFDEPTKEQLVKKFYNATKEGGYLYIGHAESFPKNTDYKYIQPAVYRKPFTGGADNERQ